MLALLSRLYSQREVIPINWLNLPLWAWDTYQDRRSHNERIATETGGNGWSLTPKPELKGAVFVIGAPRSGTTFLGDSLSVLPEISYHHEPLLTKAATRYVYEQTWSEARSAWLFRQTYGWLMRMQGEQHLRFCEKTPSNGLIVPFLASTFPDARFLHIVRDGRDAAVSLSQKPWYVENTTVAPRRDADGYRIGTSPRFYIEPERRQEYQFTSDLHRCIWLWRRYVEEIEKGLSEISATRVHEIRYEDLVSAPESISTDILNFIGIEKAESRDVFQKSICSEVSASSVGRWQSAVSEEQHQQMLEEAGDCLSRRGYPLDTARESV